MDAMEILTALGTPAVRANPYPHYAALHGLGEVVRPAPSVVMVAGYDAISSVLRDPGFLTDDAASWDKSWPAWQEQPVMVQGADWLLNLDGPRHARIRGLMARTFTARRVAGLEPAIAAMTDGLLDDMADRAADGSAIEFMHDFAYRLPVTVICELLGIPDGDREGFRPIARDLTGIFELNDPESLPVINAAAIDLLAYFTGLAAKRRAEPRDDLVSDLLAVSETGDGRLTDAELLNNLSLLLVAGFETTTNLLGNGLQVILTQPGVGDAVRSGRVQVGAFVEEVLRFDSPVQLTSRVGYDTKVAGVVITDGDQVITVLGAGNRDPRRFADPDIFNPLRADGGPLSFGGGAHFCIGAALARLEAGVAFPRLLRRFPRIAPAGEPVRRDTLLLRGFDALPVTVR